MSLKTLLHNSETTLGEYIIHHASNVCEFCVKILDIVNVVKKLKSYGFGEISSINCLKQISSSKKTFGIFNIIKSFSP